MVSSLLVKRILKQTHWNRRRGKLEYQSHPEWRQSDAVSQVCDFDKFVIFSTSEIYLRTKRNHCLGLRSKHGVVCLMSFVRFSAKKLLNASVTFVGYLNECFWEWPVMYVCLWASKGWLRVWTNLLSLCFGFASLGLVTPKFCFCGPKPLPKIYLGGAFAKAVKDPCPRRPKGHCRERFRAGRNPQTCNVDLKT